MKLPVIILILFCLSSCYQVFGQRKKNKKVEKPLKFYCPGPILIKNPDKFDCTSYFVNDDQENRYETTLVIRDQVNKIIKDTNYTTKLLSNDEFMANMTDGGGSLIGYFKENKLTRIVEEIYLSNGINITEFYLVKGQLVLISTLKKEFEFVYSESSFNYDKQKVTMDCRFYYQNEKLISERINGLSSYNGETSVSWAQNYLERCTVYSKVLSKEK